MGARRPTGPIESRTLYLSDKSPSDGLPISWTLSFFLHIKKRVRTDGPQVVLLFSMFNGKEKNTEYILYSLVRQQVGKSFIFFLEHTAIVGCSF